MNSRRLVALVMAAALAGTLAGCDRQSQVDVNRKAESAGQKLDHAIDRTRQELTVAGEKTQEKLAAAGEKTQEKLAAAGDKIQPQLAAAGEKIANAGEKVAATVKDETTRAGLADTAITASIKTDFIKDPDLSVLKIDVDTSNGVVTLNGLADNEGARTRAEKIAGAIKGVKEVRNFLTVKRA